jgi:sialidase-1
MRYLRTRFPQTRFEFAAAGIPSLGLVSHAFRFRRDVLAHGPIDLLFVEAAVNDTANGTTPEQMLRGMEGVVRQARETNAMTDLVQMHFVMPEHIHDYNRGKVPDAVAQHEKVAAYFGNASLDLSREVTDHINAKQFTWEGDFRNLHPSRCVWTK